MAGILICCFILELWKYQLGLRLFFQERLQRKWLTTAGMALYLIWYFSGVRKEEDAYLNMYYIVMVILFFRMETDWKKKLEELLLLYLVVTCIDSLCAGCVTAALEWSQGIRFAQTWGDLVSGAITAAIFLGMTAVNDRKHILKMERLIQFVRKGMVFLVVLIATEIMLAVTALDFAKDYVPNLKFKIFAGGLSGIAYLAAGILGIFIIYIKNMNEKLEQAVETERELKEVHKKYYETLLKKEEETRKYRHDLKNHLICLEGLAQEESAGRVTEYIRGMQKQTEFIQKKPFSTGNHTLDSLLNHYGSVITQDTKLIVLGKIENNLKITEADLCTVFGNLLQNAVEGVGRAQDSGKYIRIELELGREYLKIRIENSAEYGKDSIRVNGRKLWKTTKKDKINHGIGLGNVQETVERYHGILETNREKQKFIAEAVMKNRIE